MSSMASFGKYAPTGASCCLQVTRLFTAALGLASKLKRAAQLGCGPAPVTDLVSEPASVLGSKISLSGHHICWVPLPVTDACCCLGRDATKECLPLQTCSS